MAKEREDPGFAVTEKLLYCERLALYDLDRFSELKGKHEVTADVFRIRVKGEERYFKGATPEENQLLESLGGVFKTLEEALVLIGELKDNPTYETAMRLTRKAMAVADLSTEVALMLDDNWILGSKGYDARSKGGKGTRILDTEEKESFALKKIRKYQKKGFKKSPACTRAAADLLKERKIEISKDTLLKLLNEKSTKK